MDTLECNNAIHDYLTSLNSKINQKKAKLVSEN